MRKPSKTYRPTVRRLAIRPAPVTGALLLLVTVAAAAAQFGQVTPAVASPAAAARAHAPAKAAARARKAAPDTVPGMPGTPQAPTTIFDEDFENGQGTTPVLLNGYTGASGETYTADPAWL